MNKQFLTLLLLALAAYGQQQKRIAIVNTEDDGEPPIKISELTHLTDRLREIANKTLPKTNYAVMTQQSILAFLGSQENMIRECKESEGCLAKLGRKINADYIGQARIGRFGKDLTIKVEIYESGNGNLINSFTGMSKEIYGLLSVLEKEAPALFKQLPNASDGDPSTTSPTVALTPTLIPAPAPAQLIVTEYGQQLTDSRDWRKQDEEYGYVSGYEMQKVDMEHQKGQEELMKRIKERDKMKQADRVTDSSNSSRFDKIKFGFGIAGGLAGFYEPEQHIIFYTEVDTANYDWAGGEGSLGIAMNIPIWETLTFNPEAYLVYRKIEYNKDISNVILGELVLNIPLIITLAWKWDDKSPVADTYFEAGAFLDIPLSGYGIGNYAVLNVDEKKRFGGILGYGFLVGDFSLGLRATVDDTYIYLGIIARYLL